MAELTNGPEVLHASREEVVVQINYRLMPGHVRVRMEYGATEDRLFVEVPNMDDTVTTLLDCVVAQALPLRKLSNDSQSDPEKPQT